MKPRHPGSSTHWHANNFASTQGRNDMVYSDPQCLGTHAQIQSTPYTNSNSNSTSEAQDVTGRASRSMPNFARKTDRLGSPAGPCASGAAGG